MCKKNWSKLDLKTENSLSKTNNNIIPAHWSHCCCTDAVIAIVDTSGAAAATDDTAAHAAGPVPGEQQSPDNNDLM